MKLQYYVNLIYLGYVVQLADMKMKTVTKENIQNVLNEDYGRPCNQEPDAISFIFRAV